MGRFQIINFHVVVTPTHYDPKQPRFWLSATPVMIINMDSYFATQPSISTIA
jgi:hypothetical protein